jgi:hypothetical protein
MKLKKILPGVYRAELYNRIGEYAWFVKKGKKWYWYVDGYESDRYFDWYTDDFAGPFPTQTKAIADAINHILNPSNYKYF